MSSPLSTENTLDKVIGYCQQHRICTVKPSSVTGAHQHYGDLVRIGNIVFGMHGHSTGNHVYGWIVTNDDSYEFMSVPYWFSSSYCFNESRWEKGAWDAAVDEAIEALRAEMDEHKRLTSLEKQEAARSNAGAEAARKAKFEEQFVKIS